MNYNGQTKPCPLTLKTFLHKEAQEGNSGKTKETVILLFMLGGLLYKTGFISIIFYEDAIKAKEFKLCRREFCSEVNDKIKSPPWPSSNPRRTTAI